MTTQQIFLKLNDKLNVYLQYMLEDLQDQHIRYQSAIIENRPLARVAIHAYHTLLGNACTAVGQPWPAEPQAPESLAELRSVINDMHHQVQEMMKTISDEAFTRTIALPWGQEMKVEDALVDGIVHGMYHAGLIAGMRAVGGFPTPPEDY